MARARLKDVAAASGLSTATVSLVLNDAGDRFTPETVARVRETARRLGYTPNTAARSLRTKRSHAIGVVTDNILTTPSGFRMIQGAQDAAWDRDYLLFTIGTEGDEDLQRRAVDELVARQVDGFLLGSMYHRRLEFPPAVRSRPAVGFDVVVDDIPCFVPDDVGGAFQAVSLLTARGHHRIVHITEYPTDGLARALRIQGFQDGLTEAGVSDGLVVSLDSGGSPPSVAAEKASLDLLAGPERPTAIFAFNDLLALGVYRAARRLGIRIPEDLSVVGFDDRENVASETTPGLTTMALPHYEMGQRATQTLLDAISGKTVPEPVHTPVPCEVVERGSVGQAPF